MPHELHASIRVALPDEPRELADAISTITGAWSDLLGNIELHKPTSALAINETNRRVPPSDGVGRRKRGRPAAGTTHAQLPVAEEV